MPMKHRLTCPRIYIMSCFDCIHSTVECNSFTRWPLCHNFDYIGDMNVARVGLHIITPFGLTPFDCKARKRPLAYLSPTIRQFDSFLEYEVAG